MSELPESWIAAPFGALAHIIRGVTYKKEEAAEEGTLGLLPILRATNINRVLDFEELVWVPAKYVDPGQLLRRGDIVIAASSGSASVVGKAAQLKEDWSGSFGAFCMALRPDSLLNHAYVAYYLQSSEYRNLVSRLAAGVNINNLKRQHIAEIKLPTAPRPEQDRIAAEIEKQFTRLDAAVAALKRVQTNLNRYRASVLKAACEGRLVPNEAELAGKEGRSYEPASELLTRILTERRAKWEADYSHKMAAVKKPPEVKMWKSRYREPKRPDTSKFAALPEGWTWATWEQVSPRVTVGHVGPMKHRYVEDGVPFLRSQNVRANRFDSDGLLFIPEAFHKELSKSLLRPGDLVVVRSGSVGTTCVIPAHLQEANCADLVIIQKPAGVVPAYGAFYMNSTAQRLISAGKVGIALIHFNTQSVAELPVPVPPAGEQGRIVAEVERRLTTLDDLEKVVHSRLSAAIRLRQMILADAFSGKLVPQDPNDEPAFMLLERIRAERASARATKNEKNGASPLEGPRRAPVKRLSLARLPGKG